jgi:mannitol 2-dehydrogenase
MGAPDVRSEPILDLSAERLDEIARRGVPVPTYDRTALQPRIVHVGVGGFHRAHLAVYCHRLAQLGSTWGIHGVGLLPHDGAMAEALAAQDHLYTLTEKSTHDRTTEVVGSIVGYTWAPPDADASAVVDLVAAASTSIVSLTITESGYGDAPTARRTFDILAAGIEARLDQGGGPLTILSCDNLVSNGSVAQAAMLAAAARRGGDLAERIAASCSFPTSMVDRITPATTEQDRAHLRDTYGIEDRWPVVAEPFMQWVVQDAFAAGRPEFDRAGVMLSDDVHSWELYKLRLLNAGHSVIAYLAALAGIVHVDEAVTHPSLGALLTRFLQQESAPTLTEIPGHPAADYARVVVDRFENLGVRDQVARLCVDGTAKMATFVIPVLQAQRVRGGETRAAVLALAGWAHYLADVPAEHQAPDALGDDARRLARAARTDPRAFLGLGSVFPAEVAGDPRIVEEFGSAYRAITEKGPIGAVDEVVAATG